MKEIKLTQGFVAKVDDDDYDFLSQWKWFVTRDLTVSYAARTDKKNGKYYSLRMHRVIMKVDDPKVFVDHRDTDGLNNQRHNLRICNNVQSGRNRRRKKGTRSKYKGVSPAVRIGGNVKWVAKIGIGGRDKHLGSFNSEEEAAIAYNIAAEKIFGEFALLNIVL